MKMKYEDKVSLYNDTSQCMTENVPIEALSPFCNPYMKDVLDLFKRTAFINLSKLQSCLKEGKGGWETVLGQDECKMPWYGRDLPIVEHAEEIADRIRDKVGKFGDGEDSVTVMADTIIVKIPKEVMEVSASRDPVYTWTMVALCQAIAEVFNINPNTDLDGCNMLKAVVFGRYPQSITFSPGAPVSGFLKPSNVVDGLGAEYSGITVNHIVAMVNKRTMDGLALASILEGAAQWEMGNAVGWYERYNLLGYAYEGFNANNLVLDLVKENREGTITDVVYSTIIRAVEDGVIKVKNKLASGYKIYTTNDFPLWNAYELAGTTAAAIVNCGAMRSGQAAATVLGYINDGFALETGGLADPDGGRMEGAGIGFAFYTHSIYGGAGPGAYTFDHVILRGSGFIQPPIVAGMCLDSGTQLFSPEMTSSAFFKLRDMFPLLQDPLKKVAEAAEQIKGEIKKG